MDDIEDTYETDTPDDDAAWSEHDDAVTTAVEIIEQVKTKRRSRHVLTIGKQRDYKLRSTAPDKGPTVSTKTHADTYRAIQQLVSLDWTPWQTVSDFLRDSIEASLESVNRDMSGSHPMLDSYVRVRRAEAQAEWEAGEGWRLQRTMHHETDHIWGVVLQHDLDEAQNALTRLWTDLDGIAVDYWRTRALKMFASITLFRATARVLLARSYTLPVDLCNLLGV